MPSMLTGEIVGYTSPKPHLFSLPNEVLVHIFTPFSTRALLPITSVSHRLHSLILRILHYRLLIAASLKEYKLMLECFHPSSRLTEPHVFCQYLGTDGLSDKHEGEGSLYADCQTAERLGRLTALYSRFRPDPDTEEKYVIPNRRPRVGAIIGPDGMPTPVEPVLGEGGAEAGKENYIPKHEPIGGFVKRTITIESFEEFSQLCAIINLVKVAPTSALLLSANTVNDGIIRVWRDWLRRHSNVVKRNVGDAPHGPITSPDRDDDDAILWVDGVKNVGLKLKVRERRWNRDVPVLQHRDEEMVVSYELYIEELWIRTTRLLLTVEASIDQQRHDSKAIIIGSYRIPGA